MLSIKLPVIGAEKSFEACISIVDDEDLKARLESVTDHIETADTEFQKHAASLTLYQLKPSGDVAGTVTAGEMKTVYESRMSRRKTPGRAVYDQILAKAPKGFCPFCVQRVANTLDHHLPKMKYPALAVTPANLIPACKNCNETKRAKTPLTSSDQTFHPYFDSVDDEVWLAARIVEVIPASAVFYVRAPTKWDVVKTARIKKTFESLELAELFSIHAGAELSGIRFELSRLFGVAGLKGVRDHLAHAAESFTQDRSNSWKTAVYTAWSASDWFCDQGFREEGWWLKSSPHLEP